MNKNLIIAFLAGVIITFVVVNYLPKFDIKIEVTERAEPVKEDKPEKIELSEQTSIIDRLKSKISPEPIPEMTADEFLLQNYPDTRISYDKEFSEDQKSKARKTMSKEVGKEFIKAQKLLSDDKPDEALKILEGLLNNQKLREYEIAVILRFKGYVYAEKEDYQKSLDLLAKSFSMNALEPQSQLDLQFGIAQVYLAIDQWGNGLYEILDWFKNYKSSGGIPGPSFQSLVSQIYLYLASETEPGSLAEKQFYQKAEPYAEMAVNHLEFRENWLQIYLSILLFDERYEEARPILEVMVQKFPERDTYKRQLSGLYYELGVNDGLIPPEKSSQESIFIPYFDKPQHFGVFSASEDADALVIVKVPPQYPRKAITKRIEGWVLLEFTVTQTGAVINPKVIDADPPGIFNESALRVIKKWKYKPKIENGKAIQQKGIQHVITYEFEKAK